ncbi:MAG: nucleosidase [Alphaproteobacteria bacterium]|nr:nucleosidase [Alphaproteobacteria bacterium]
MTFSRDNTLIVFAIHHEAKDSFDPFHVLFCGVGKVNAAYHLARSLDAWEKKHNRKPELVLNLGSAGSTHFTKETIINCTHFIQRDFDITALGAEPFATPFEDHLPRILDHGLSFPPYEKGTCGTGDNFVTSAAQGPWDVIDMEAYALAKVCLLEKVPFGCLKYISDGADGHAAGTWEDSLGLTAQRLRVAVDKIF